MFDDVIERQEPAKIDGRIGEPPVADVGNAQFPVDALMGDPAGLRAIHAANNRNRLFHGKFEVHEALNETLCAAMMRMEISGVLGTGEHTAVETDHCNPLGVLRFPSEPFKVFFTLSQMWNHGYGFSVYAKGQRFEKSVQDRVKSRPAVRRSWDFLRRAILTVSAILHCGRHCNAAAQV